MAGNVIELQFGKPKRDGNGAREVVIALMALTLPETSQADVEIGADWLLMELAMRGFKVVPL